MNHTLKKSEIFGAVFGIVVGTLMHFFYDWSGKNPVVALFAPCSESTWEHLKLLFFPVLIYSVFQYTCIGKQYLGFFTGRLAGIVSGTLTIVIIFYTYMTVFKHSILWIDITLFYLSVIICYRIAYLVTLRAKISRMAEILSGISLLSILLIFFYRTILQIYF